MSADKSDPSDRRRLQTEETVVGELVIDGEGLQSTGHVIVPAGAFLTFNTDQASTIAGTGLDNHGTMTVKEGAITVAAGGIRSNSATSAIAVEGGALDFASSAPSLIGGFGISVDPTASVSITSGPVAFNMQPTGSGSISVASNANVYLSTDSGASCSDFAAAQSCTVADVIQIDAGAIATAAATCANLAAIGGCVGHSQSVCGQLSDCCTWTANACAVPTVVRNDKVAGSVGPATASALVVAISMVLRML